MRQAKFCPAVWLSGFFGLGALVHLVRWMLGFSLIVAGHEVPVKASALLFAVLGTLSAGALFLGLKRPCCESKKGCEKSKEDCSDYLH